MLGFSTSLISNYAISAALERISLELNHISSVETGFYSGKIELVEAAAKNSTVSLNSPSLQSVPPLVKTPRVIELKAKGTFLNLSISPDPISIEIENISAILKASNLLITVTADDIRAKCNLLFHCELSGIVELQNTHPQLKLSWFPSNPVSISADSVSLSGPFSLSLDANSFLNFTSEAFTLEVESLKSPMVNSSISFRTKITDLSFEGIGKTKFPNIKGEVQSEYINFENAPITPIEPLVSGFLRSDLETISAIFELRSGDRAILGASVQHDWMRTTGSLDLQLDLPKLTTSEPLSKYIGLANLNSDLTGGDISLRSDIGWTERIDGSWDFGGPLITKLNDVSGYYNDTIFSGASGTITLAVENPFSLNTLNYQALHVDKIDAGFVLTNIETYLDINSQAKSFNLLDTKARFLQGELNLQEITLLKKKSQSRFDLILTGIDLAELMALMPYDGLEITGRVSGHIPIILDNENLEIRNGYISALNPGGSIFYTPQNKEDINPSMQLVNEALEHYNFETLNSTLTLKDDGEIEIAVALLGESPAMNGGQKINLNLNINDNLNALLQSLLASRQIEEGFELRYSR